MAAGEDDLGRRVRAARGYAGISQSELAARVGVSTATVKRLEGAERTPRGFGRQGLIAAVSRATGVPQGWFTIDLERLNAQASASPLPARLERAAAQLGEAVAELRAAYAAVPDAGEPALTEPGGRVSRRPSEGRPAAAAPSTGGALAEPLEELARAAAQQPASSARTRSGSPTRRRAG